MRDSSITPPPIVTAAQMQALETAMFGAGMPIAALMEKVAGQMVQWLQGHVLPSDRSTPIGILVGPGHNGGDALVVARELKLLGYGVRLYHPFERRKPLTDAHYRYAQYLGITEVSAIAELQNCPILIDGIFGLGQTREIMGELAAAIATVNGWPCTRVSLDLPTGIATDTGAVLGTAIRATHTLCLGVWKRACFQETAVDYLGALHCLDFGVPEQAIATVCHETPRQGCLTEAQALAAVPLHRQRTTHKYRQGHLLLIGGSQQYGGSIVLAGLGARASGVGMLTIAVPESLKPLVLSQLPEALVVACAETSTGAIAALPADLDLSKFTTVACGPGLTTENLALLETIWTTPAPLLLDADALNLLALKTPATPRESPTLLTPHLGEFRRLFPEQEVSDRWTAISQGAAQRQAIILLKGARTLVATPQGEIWAIPNGTPALARGGSGDVLTGLAGGWLAQTAPEQAATTLAAAAWFHAAAAQHLSKQQTVLGVDPVSLAAAIDEVVALVFAQASSN
ncbi:MAG: NAD(P)H-hydrate dehydratase [Spirulina sp. SIO3F2]|nr:NAD(P)H-hydrate dehydratase [Spirulina sp. SIO3F2]